MYLSDTIKHAGADRFGFDLKDAVRLGGGGAPDGFVLANPRDPVVIKFMPATEDRLPVMRAKMDFVNYLRAGGVPTPGYLPSVNEEMIELVSDEEATFAVMTLHKAPGKPVDFRNPAEWNAHFFRQWGNILGQIHALSATYTAASRAAIPAWEEEHAFFCTMCQDDPGILAQWQRIGAQVRDLPQSTDAFGPIHNDAHSHNFLLHEGSLTILDFDVCTRHWFALDLAIALFHPIFESRHRPAAEVAAFARELTDHFLAGYDDAYTLDPSWLDHLALFMRYRRTLFYIVLPKDGGDPWTQRTVRDLRPMILDNVPPVTGLV
ncbi:MAG: phosphotransferase [Anaerolineae bacterium]|nr:phosphotransferase [Anaerolineae bacterium]